MASETATSMPLPTDVGITAAEWAVAFDSPDPGTPHNLARDDVWEEVLTILADKLVDALVRAETRRELVAAARALDRVLMHKYIVVPHWYSSTHRVAYRSRFGMPATAPLSIRQVPMTAARGTAHQMLAPANAVSWSAGTKL